jgi:hypothetical protein
VYIYWGLENTFDNTLSKNILKIEYLPIKEAVQEMADTLIDTGYIPDKRKK